MIFITIEEVQSRLPEIIAAMIPDEELTIERDNEAVATLVKILPRLKEPRKPGWGKDSILYMADDFDAPLEELKEYME